MPEVDPSKSRRNFLLVGGPLVILLAVLIFWQVSLNVGIMPTGSEQTVLLFALSTLVSLAFLIFGFILTRSLVKLYIERRGQQLGAKFKTKLVIGALALSLLPVIFLFYFTYVFTNRTLNRWFTQPFASATRQAREIVVQTTSYATRETETDASAVAAGPVGEALREGDEEMVRDLAKSEAHRQGLDYLAVETNSGTVAAVTASGPSLQADMIRHLSLPERRGRRAVSRVVTALGADYAVAVFPVDANRSPNPSGWIIAANRLPTGLSDALQEMDKEREEYERLYQQNKGFRTIYTAIQVLITVIILFITTWAALFLSKQVTTPVQALAEATHQVALGNLSHRIRLQAVDELGVLVRSFNEMAARLEESGTELERRRRETEAVLESIPTPIISLARDRRILRVNPAVERIFGAERAKVTQLRDLLAPDDLREMEHLLRRAQRLGLATSQFELGSALGRMSVAVTVSALPLKQDAGYRGQDIAFIIVMEDVSDLLHAQQAQAWRDVAQRVAHEIKNPLTPIALSAERLRRRLSALEEARTTEEMDETRRVIADCTSLIEQEVGTLKTLVDEFSQLARFPKAQLQEAPLNPIVENALSVFDGRLDGIQVCLDLASDLPPVHVDPEQFKRVIVNLVDNAAEAMQDSLIKEVRITTGRIAGADLRGDFIEVVVADTGPGVSPEVKEKLFLPYFSTKKRGTGLGLAIVSRILAEHRGTIRVEENHPVGARFIVELPV